MWWDILVKQKVANRPNKGRSNFVWSFWILNTKFSLIDIMQKVSMDQNWHSQFQEKCFYLILLNCFFIPKFQFSDQYLIKWLQKFDKLFFFDTGASLTGPWLKLFFETYLFAQMDAKKWPNRMQGGRDIRQFIVHRVTESQVTESHYFHSLYGRGKFFMPIFN